MMQEKRELLGRGGRQVVSAALVLTAALFFLPALMVGGEPVYQRPETGELPGGEAVLPHIGGVPVIVLSAKAGVEEKVSLLLGGAADYLTKPFDTRELLARISVQLRRGSQERKVCQHKGLALDLEAREVRVDGRAVHLTRTEFGIIKLLMENPRQVIPKSRLLDQLSGETPDCVESSLKVHVSNLRKKLREAGAGEVIESVWGIGFKLAD